MFKETLLKTCAPTVMRVKASNIFTVKAYKNIFDDICEVVNKFKDEKLRLTLLRRSANSMLFILYNTDLLEEILFEEKNRDFLLSKDFCYESTYEAIKCLKDKLCQSDCFPHEIGIYLGYPLSDVVDFINHKGKNCKICGVWKAYNNVDDAIKTFELYEKSKKYCMDLLSEDECLVKILNKRRNFNEDGCCLLVGNR